MVNPKLLAELAQQSRIKLHGAGNPNAPKHSPKGKKFGAGSNPTFKNTADGEKKYYRQSAREERSFRKSSADVKSYREREIKNRDYRERVKEETRAGNERLLQRTESYDGFFKPLAGTMATGIRSAMGNLKQEGNLKRAGIGMAQSTAASAAGHGGLAAIQGEDPWEAAKTGAIRGAMIGGGYQGLKAATHANTGSLWGNVKQIGSTGQDLYRANTTKGNAALQKSGMSGQLARVLEQGKRVENSSGIFGF